MSDDSDQDLIDAAALIEGGIAELRSRCALLEIGLESQQRTNAILIETVAKQAADLERATVANKRLFTENMRIVRTLTGTGNLIKDGLAEINAARGNTVQLRGSPPRLNEIDPASLKVVRGGPQGA
jgi:hypothetical protein